MDQMAVCLPAEQTFISNKVNPFSLTMKHVAEWRDWKKILIQSNKNVIYFDVNEVMSWNDRSSQWDNKIISMFDRCLF